jgi:hypothetical protein
MNRPKCTGAVFLALFLFVMSSLNVQGQSFKSVSISPAENKKHTTTNRIDGSPMLLKIDNDVAKIAQQDPEVFNKMKLEKRSAWNYTVGSTHPFWTLDTAGNYVSTPATCRLVGKHCYLFVENASFNNPFTLLNVDTLVDVFDNRTPANSHKGIYDTDTTNFGPIPDVDNDPKVIILVVNLQNRGGYFSAVNEYSQAALNASGYSQYKSNDAEMFYIDATQDITYSESTLAHEFQHMIHFNYFGIKTDANDLTFINEGWSMVAEILCGFSPMSRSYYEGQTGQYLYHWASAIEDANPDYSRASWFAYYLNEQIGKSIFRKYLQNSIIGSAGITTAMAQLGSSRTFESVLKDWFFANAVFDSTYNNGKWGYRESALTSGTTGITGNQFINPNLSLKDSINRFSVRYFTFKSGNNFNIKFNTNNSNINVASVSFQGSTKTVQEYSDPSDISISGLGGAVNQVTFIVYYNSDADSSKDVLHKFSYQSTGSFDYKPVEIKYDLTNALGYLSLSQGDSVAVYFDGIPGGANLDSIRVSLAGNTPLNGSLKNYLGFANQLGGKNLANFTLIPKVTSNWVTADLHSLKINPVNSFVVELPVGATYPVSNRVMVTDYQSTSEYHSFTYFSTDTPPDWGYIGDQNNPGNVFIYLIRAYVSFTPPTGVKQTIELVPSSFKLNQNYPNPFNPSTVISYQLASLSKIQIKVYDILGKEIATLVNGQKPAGNYQIIWDGTDSFGNKVTSGVYFYRINTDNFVQTKKMILMK